VKTNHWGYQIDSEVATTGVFHASGLEYLNDDCFDSSSIDLAWEDHKLHCDKYKENEECDCDYESDRFLIGFKLGKVGLFEPDEEAEYSAIVNFDRNTIQIIRSRWGIRCALCSPCYPGQGDGDTPGEFLAYAPPPEIIGDYGNQEVKKRIFLIEEEGK